MPKSVPNVPTHEEYFGLVDNILEDEDFEVVNDDEDIEKMIVIMLALLQEFYILHMYEEAYYFASEQFKEDIDNFNNELKDNLLILLSSYVTSLTAEYNVQWMIPSGKVNAEVELTELINSGIDAVTSTLYSDLKDKADFYTLLSETTGTFSPHSNFRRAVKKLANQVDFKGHHIRNLVERNYLGFVYGQEALFKWVVSGVNTCAWCYEIASMGAMPLSWFPVDHVNGHCVLVPVNPDVYSEEYNQLRGL